MKLSKLIKRLDYLWHKHGDIDVCYVDDPWVMDVTKAEIWDCLDNNGGTRIVILLEQEEDLTS